MFLATEASAQLKDKMREVSVSQVFRHDKQFYGTPNEPQFSPNRIEKNYRGVRSSKVGNVNGCGKVATPPAEESVRFHEYVSLSNKHYGVS